MVEVRGCLRSLFIYKGQPMINFETEFERLAKSLIDELRIIVAGGRDFNDFP